MSLTLLLDLDNTLLQNNVDIFVPAYLQAWGNFMKDQFEPNRFIAQMLASNRVITENMRPERSLSETFYSDLLPALGIDANAFQVISDQFYREVFPGLQSLTKPMEGVVEMVQEAFNRGYRIAIATNPYFPQNAINQRLAWAGLPVEQYPFNLIASFDTYHYAKPNQAFFAETLGRMGWNEEPVIMVGDELDTDIRPAREFGLTTYWISPDGEPPPLNFPMPHGYGRLAEFIPWLDHHLLNLMPISFQTPANFLAILRSTPGILLSRGKNYTKETWQSPPTPGEWSPIEIICHLRDVELEVNIPRIKSFLKEKNPFLVGVDSDRWAVERNYNNQNGKHALSRFIEARLETIAILETLDADQWRYEARHAIFGRTNLCEIVSFIAGHDRIHIQQLNKTD